MGNSLTFSGLQTMSGRSNTNQPGTACTAPAAAYQALEKQPSQQQQQTGNPEMTNSLQHAAWCGCTSLTTHVASGRRCWLQVGGAMWPAGGCGWPGVEGLVPDGWLGAGAACRV